MIPIFIAKYWRVFAIGGALLVLGWWHQHAVSKAYRQGATDREKSALVEAAKKVEADVAEKTKQLDERAASLDEQEARTRGERSALVTAQAGIKSALATGLNQIATKGVDLRNEIQAVPDDAINGRFRLALERAREAERERTVNR